MPPVNKSRSKYQPSSTARSHSRLGWRLYLIITIVAGLLFLALNIPVIGVISLGLSSIKGGILWGVLIGLPLLIANIWLFRWLKDNIQVYRWTIERRKATRREGENAG